VEHLATTPESINTLKEALKFFDKKKNGAAMIADDLAKLMGINQVSDSGCKSAK